MRETKRECACEREGGARKERVGERGASRELDEQM